MLTKVIDGELIYVHHIEDRVGGIHKYYCKNLGRDGYDISKFKNT